MKLLNSAIAQQTNATVLFPFDDASIPFSRSLYTTLVAGRKFPDEIDHGLNIVLDDRFPTAPLMTQGQPGTLDSTEVLCPNVFYVEGEYRMWYLGADDNKKRRTGLYAVSKDGFVWTKPSLGLVEINGSTDNNLVSGPCGEWVLYDPQDPDPQRRFKSLYMAQEMRINTSYSPDGLHWTDGAHDIFGIGCELGTVFRFNGCYYANGQGGPAPINRTIPHPIELASKRVMLTYASYDFETWTHSAALSFRRDNIPPRLPTDFEPHRGPQVHEGAPVWDRGSVLLGFYGMWDCPRNDRRYWSQDIGFVISHDGIQFKEPVPDFKMVHSYEETDGGGEFLVQRNAFANIGDRSIYWYSAARTYPHEPTGVKIATWVRDRFGFFSAARPDKGICGAYDPHCISCPIEITASKHDLFLNVDGLGPHTQLSVELLDMQFRPIPGFSGADKAIVAESGIRQAAKWGHNNSLVGLSQPIRVRVNWEGIRPEDGQLFSIALEEAS